MGTLYHIGLPFVKRGEIMVGLILDIIQIALNAAVIVILVRKRGD